uniref:Uncharacterized protein n=1 Tax=Ackermannviridae sp. TaxID=2831612 RepID=A0A8S5VKP3_9CAUD|nr:MAG TPA: hypothetical protein [Ackermannviridae sp.]
MILPRWLYSRSGSPPLHLLPATPANRHKILAEIIRRANKE